ncbi:MAG: hypothetical protein A2287_00190 [Candidatus Melainabacteria bacterium RIFOXYA12_FULL_32_12]|nr:MAG: hypothetical protein A2104_03325 [Candidatus Melainabacteria bacterium GWF2_32_7]OGI16926.1 MAG: hypothetical protein A2255_07200 [Candidatus Melainabacteria bacterium RIFOXYA2_FULL_32_9]OGI31443.1 MAG: hypothetical protein A2287_00190 [Candidatus Melainabacteria bacterium RIFOXYA12_FULL_32_12]
MKLLIKSSVVLGAIAGAILGVILLIPFIQAFACFAYVLVGAGIVFYLKRNSFVGILSTHDGALIGAISGFTALVASSLVYLPIYSLINMVFRATSGLNPFGSFWVTSYSLFVIPMLIFFLALLSALFNAFSGLAVTYIYGLIENNSVQEDGEILIEQE